MTSNRIQAATTQKLSAFHVSLYLRPPKFQCGMLFPPMAVDVQVIVDPPDLTQGNSLS